MIFTHFLNRFYTDLHRSCIGIIHACLILNHWVYIGLSNTVYMLYMDMLILFLLNTSYAFTCFIHVSYVCHMLSVYFIHVLLHDCYIFFYMLHMLFMPWCQCFLIQRFLDRREGSWTPPPPPFFPFGPLCAQKCGWQMMNCKRLVCKSDFSRKTCSQMHFRL